MYYNRYKSEVENASIDHELERSFTMAKKFGKFLLFTAAVSGAAAGAYYYLKKKNTSSEPEDDEFDDFDDFGSDLDDAKDASKEQQAADTESRGYVDITDKAKEVKDTVADTAKAVKDTAADTAKDAIDKFRTETAKKTEEFFDDEDNSNDAM